ncbi:hypothetical protein ACUN0C_19250 [Faunimonas sp. B44]|uniref:hypothetical protein n=1 Tax=Faunimonas sp. B44 TaxID=3461493 RepID=UPI004043F42C
MRPLAILTVLMIAVGSAGPAWAQDSFTKDPLPFLGNPEGFTLPAPAPGLAPVPYAPPASAHDPTDALGTELLLEARATESGPPIAEGVIWRVFGERPGSDGELPLVATARGGTTSIQLEPGAYLVHAGFGRAGATKRVTVGKEPMLETMILDAGGLRLSAVTGDDRRIAPERLTFEISRDDEQGERVLIVPNAKPDRVLRLQAGTYHVVSRYGQVNAVVRADIEVAAGKLTDMMIRHAGAQATLKLVAEEGGEALANTGWAVLTKDGDTLQESVGAFPQIILAEGEYTAVARHKGRMYSREFRIDAGVDRDVEVRLIDIVAID